MTATGYYYTTKLQIIIQRYGVQGKRYYIYYFDGIFWWRFIYRGSELVEAFQPLASTPDAVPDQPSVESSGIGDEDSSSGDDEMIDSIPPGNGDPVIVPRDEEPRTDGVYGDPSGSTLGPDHPGQEDTFGNDGVTTGLAYGGESRVYYDEDAANLEAYDRMSKGETGVGISRQSDGSYVVYSDQNPLNSANESSSDDTYDVDPDILAEFEGAEDVDHPIITPEL